MILYIVNPFVQNFMRCIIRKRHNIGWQGNANMIYNCISKHLSLKVILFTGWVSEHSSCDEVPSVSWPTIDALSIIMHGITGYKPASFQDEAVGAVKDVSIHDDVIKWTHFPHYWPFVRGIHRSPVNSPTKASDSELWCFLWSEPE